MGLKNLFSLKSDIQNTTQPAQVALEVNIRKPGETHAQWGTRWAGQTTAANTALTPALNCVILAEKNDQKNNKQLQENNRNNIQSQIQINENNKKAEQNKITSSEGKIEKLQKKINEKSEQINKLKEGNSKRPMATVYFWIGALLSTLLALYLFIFYSSASYSAFFRTDDTMDVGNAIFYPQAYSDAISTSIEQFLLILLMPVIFLGLGFLVHQYTKKQGAGKYLKVIALYAITFIFDALLAFEISEKMYLPTPEAPNYTMSMAFESPNFWIIIFAGFIAYVIWGLVFDFTIEAYSEMTEGAITIKRLQKEIDEDNANIQAEQNKITSYNNNITDLDNKISNLRWQLDNTAGFDMGLIKLAVNEFFKGWIGFMRQLALPEHELKDAQAQLNSVLASLENQ